jgi:hypothetical protein
MKILNSTIPSVPSSSSKFVLDQPSDITEYAKTNFSRRSYDNERQGTCLKVSISAGQQCGGETGIDDYICGPDLGCYKILPNVKTSQICIPIALLGDACGEPKSVGNWGAVCEKGLHCVKGICV